MDVKLFLFHFRFVLKYTQILIYFQQIAFKNLAARNKETERRICPPPTNKIKLPFILINTHKDTVIDCSISPDKYVEFYK